MRSTPITAGLFAQTWVASLRERAIDPLPILLTMQLVGLLVRTSFLRFKSHSALCYHSPSLESESVRNTVDVHEPSINSSRKYGVVGCLHILGYITFALANLMQSLFLKDDPTRPPSRSAVSLSRNAASHPLVARQGECCKTFTSGDHTTWIELVPSSTHPSSIPSMAEYTEYADWHLFAPCIHPRSPLGRMHEYHRVLSFI